MSFDPRTFQGHPVLFPLSPSHQLQFPLLLQGDKGFEEEPPSFPDNPLLLLKEQIQLFQRAEGLAAGLHSLCGRFHLLCVGPAHFQLSHEILVDILSADRVSGFASVRQGLSQAP